MSYTQCEKCKQADYDKSLCEYTLVGGDSDGRRVLIPYKDQYYEVPKIAGMFTTVMDNHVPQLEEEETEIYERVPIYSEEYNSTSQECEKDVISFYALKGIPRSKAIRMVVANYSPKQL